MLQTSTISDSLIALIRTIVPLIAGFILAQVAKLGLGLPESTGPLLETLLVTTLTAAYYAAVRALSEKWAWFGWLLGHPANPSYTKSGDHAAG